MRAGRAIPDDYYYGHDYRAADLVRFFSPADVGLPAARIQALRAEFCPGIPVAWRKRFVPAPISVAAAVR